MARQVSPKTPRLSSLFRTHIRCYIPASGNGKELERRIRTQCLSGKINLEEALFYLDCLASDSRRPFPPSCLHHLLSSLSTMGYPSLAVSRFNSLSSVAGFRPGAGTLSVLLRCFCLLRRPDLALSVLAPMLKLALGPRAPALADLIRALFASSHSPQALRLFHTAESNNLADEFTYSVVIHGLCKAGETSKALALLRRLPSPDAACFSPVLDSLCRDHADPDAALRLFDEMSEDGIAPNRVLVASLVGNLCRLGRWADANKLLLGPAKDWAGEEVYNAAVDSLFKCGKPREATEAFKAMVRARVRPTELTLTSLVSGLARSDRLEEALHLFAARPGASIPGPLLRALCRAGRVAEAMGLAEAHRGYNRILQECFGAGRWREGFEAAERMRWRGVEPDAVTFTVIAAALGERGRVKEALSLFKEMVVRGLGPDRAARAVLKAVLARRPKARFANRARARRLATDVVFRRRGGSWW